MITKEKQKEIDDYNLMVQRAASVPFSPYAKFMLATKGYTFRDTRTLEKLTRFQVWLRENHDPASIKRIIDSQHSRYLREDRTGWKDGLIVDKVKAGMIMNTPDNVKIKDLKK